jgi:hypothetical protein
MDRRLIFPAVAITAWAQQPSPAAAEAEAALRARAEQFFQLQVDKKYRQGEAMVAESAKDDYYNGNKYNIKSFSIQKVELLDGNTRAKVILKARTTIIAAAIGRPVDFDVPVTSLWKIEDGKWAWYTEPVTAVQTPFGVIHPGQTSDKPAAIAKVGAAPDIAMLQSSVKIDRNSIVLTPEAPTQIITVSNGLPGGVDLELSSDPIKGLSAELEKKRLEAGEKTVIRFKGTGKDKASGTVRLVVTTLATKLDISVSLN